MIGTVKINKISNQIIRISTRKIETIVQNIYKRQNKWLKQVLRKKEARIAKVIVQGEVHSSLQTLR